MSRSYKPLTPDTNLSYKRNAENPSDETVVFRISFYIAPVSLLEEHIVQTGIVFLFDFCQTVLARIKVARYVERFIG